MPASIQRLRITLLSPHDPNDIGTWSGTAYSVYHALLQSSASVDIVRAAWTDGFVKIAIRLLRIAGVTTDYTRSVLYAYLASAEASVRLRFTRGEVIVALAAPYVFALKTSRPIIFMSDATFASISRLYPVYSDMPKWLRKHADKVEHDALHNSDHVFYSSEWARNSAVVDYDVATARLSVMPLGPNISSQVIDRFKTTKVADFSNGVRLLFIGAEWNRKGGPVVLDIKRNLDSRGIPCELFVAGECPKNLPADSGIHFLGRLNKSDAKQLQELCGLYELAHFFVLPTSAEAFGIVFSEAQAFGCPSLTYAVGGTPTAVSDGITGFTLPLGAVANDFAEKICSLVQNPQQYEQMSANCRTRYETEANWGAWARSVLNSAHELRDQAAGAS